MARRANAYRGLAAEAYSLELQAYATALTPADLSKKTAWWLKSDFWGEEWKCEFGDNITLTFSWSIRLDNGISLTEKTPLSEALRNWLVVQSHHKVNRGFREKPHTISSRIGVILRLIDYFLLHYPHEEFLRGGFSSISSAEVKALLIRIGTSDGVESSFYDWPNRASAFITELISAFASESDIPDYIEKFKGISDIAVAAEDRTLIDFDDKKILLARIALLKARLYKAPRITGNETRFEPNTPAIAESIYKNTLRGALRKSTISELSFGEWQSYDRECPSAYTRHGDENEVITEATLKVYARRLRTLILIEPIAFRPSAAALQGLDVGYLYHSLPLSPRGRFRSVPNNHLMYALNRAISFFLENSDHLMSSYKNLAIMAKRANVSVNEYITKNDIGLHIHTQTRKMGVCTFSLRNFLLEDSTSAQKLEIPKRFHELLRESYGLLDALRVLYGAIGLTLGLLSARRRSELCRLRCKDFLDNTKTNLLFYAAKTGQGEYRELMARPVPPIVARMLCCLASFQEDMVTAGIIEHTSALLAIPSFNGAITADGELIELAMDAFLDFIEMPTDAAGARYYVRFHQARRFLPQLFMDSGTDTDLGILQWLLGHTDPSQIWNYILSNCTGDALNQAAAQTATAQLKAGNEAFDDLSNLLLEKYGVRDFWAMTDDELAGYILLLEEDGDVKVEMEFLDCAHGLRHKMLMKVIRRRTYDKQPSRE